jgi:hypothetical protein
MKVTTKIQVTFDTDDILADLTEEELEEYCIETFIDDIYNAVKYDELKDWVRVTTEKGQG